MTTAAAENAAVSLLGLSPSISAATSDSSAAFTSLKRKRPPRIEIPNVLQEIKTDKSHAPPPRSAALCSACENGVAVFAAKGKKKFMEDAHRIVSSCLRGSSKTGFFGVFDGHGGSKAAEFAAENLHSNVTEMMERCAERQEAFRAAYLKTDHDFLQQGVGSGTCCVTVLVDENEVVVSNLGDCRAVLSRGGVAEALTTDHTATLESEHQRIQDKGGYVEFHRGAWRVHGILAVSRSIGDAHLKDWVLGEPETRILQLTPDMEFVVLASDGLWEKVGNQETIDIVNRVCSTKKKMALTGNGLKVDDEVRRCVSVSPSTNLRRILLAKEPKVIPSPRELQINDNEESCCVSEIPSSKLHSISPVKQPNGTQWPGELITDSEDYGHVNVSPSSKLRRISLVKKPKGTQSPGHKKTLFNYKEADNDFPSENESPPSKSRRLSMVKRVHLKTDPPVQEKTGYEMRSAYGENEFVSENEAPPSKSRRISLVKRANMKIESPINENGGYTISPASGGLLTACKELVNLALSRGSLDDITVMIIDLNHFRCN